MSSSTNESSELQIDESGFDMAEEFLEGDEVNSDSREGEPPESVSENLPVPSPIVDYEDSNSFGSSKDAGPPFSRSLSPGVVITTTTPPQPSPPQPSPPPSPPESSNSQKSLIQSSSQVSPSQTTQEARPCKRKSCKKIDDYFAKREENLREDNRACMRLFADFERERIRQRDIELRQRDEDLRLQAQWLELMQEALKVIEKYFNDRR